MSVLTSRSSNDHIVPYGVDWSIRAHPSSHCWFPFTSDDSSTVQSCAYNSCGKGHQTGLTALLQCQSCDVIIHAYHLTNSSTTNDDSIQSCRPSFFDNKEQQNAPMDSEDNVLQSDKHFWSHVSKLLEPCLHCQLTFVISPLDFVDQMKSMINDTPETLSNDPSNASHGLVCLWCFQCYHHSCWEQLTPQNQLQC
ncbi:unnamed protein product, partial [Rotaria sp. Silwood2]